VRRCKIWFAVVATLIMASAVGAAALPAKAEAASTKSKLRTAKVILRKSKVRLKTAQAALAAVGEGALGASTTGPTPSATPTPTPTPTADPAPTVEELEARVAKARRAVRVWTKRVVKLTRRYRLEQSLIRWEKQHRWRKIIEVAAARYHVRADGMYRMMMRESGGRQYAGSSTPFKGLFQYWTGTWAASWNPWRRDNIYDGSSQIFATAYAIHKGMGPQMWTTTFASQY
jgi:hypothetical protein